MPTTDVFARLLMLFGGVLLFLGLLLFLVGRAPFRGRLPGDILFHRGSSTFYFPVISLLLLSLLLTLLLNVVLRLLRG